MAENDSNQIERVSSNSKKEIAEIKKALIAVLNSIKKIEEELDECFMPQGDFLGVKFDE